ncbi:MAG: hypothetical protein SWK76_11745 [Actinomycetota bacterium]|nr:hypothetical protein [Actinomycetota bacterium]
MRTCPWCGRSNLDSDEYCFNCERSLDATPSDEDFRELERETRKIRLKKPPSIAGMIFMSILKKLLFILLALGVFCIFALVAIWVSYDSAALSLAVLAVLGFAVLYACYYPDYDLSRRIGVRGTFVSVISNVILLGIILPPSLWFLSRRGYISGSWHFLSRTWWGLLAFVILGGLIAWLAGYRTAAETARP